MSKHEKSHRKPASDEPEAPRLWTPGEELPPEAAAAADIVSGEPAGEAAGEASEAAGAAGEVDRLKDALARARAEIANAVKRGARERERTRVLAQRDLAAALLPALDGLELAVAHADGERSPDGAALLQGVRLARDELVKGLSSCGLAPIEARAGEGFDPTLHEAVATVPTEDAPAGTILEVLRPGYAFGEFVIRPAQAVVARPPVAAPEPPEPPADPAEAGEGE